MKIDSIRRISREDLEGAPDEEWIDKLLDPVNSTSENVVQALRGNLGFTDNTTSGFKEVDLTHAVETRVANPLKVRPKGIIAVRALELSAGLLTGNPIENPRIKWRNADNGDVFVTPSFDGRHTEPLLVKRLASAMSVPNNTPTTINTWQTDASAESRRTNVITESGGTFTVSEAGAYSVALQLSYQEGVTYTNCQGRLQAAGGNNRFLPQISAALTDAAWISMPAIFDLAAGATFVAQGFQTNAAIAARNLLSGFGNTRIAISRLYNSTIYSARTTLFFFGD